MVVFRQLDDNGCAFDLRPNSSLGWRRMKWVFLALMGCIVAVSVYFVSLGAWLVLPFAGLEILVVGIGVYANACWANRREVVDLRDNRVRVWRGSTRLQEVDSFPSGWTRTVMLTDSRGWYPSRLMLECYGRRVEVGASLVESERLELWTALRTHLGYEQVPSPALSDPVPTGLNTASQEI